MTNQDHFNIEMNQSKIRLMQWQVKIILTKRNQFILLYYYISAASMRRGVSRPRVVHLYVRGDFV